MPWEAVIALDGASPDRLPASLAQDPRVRTLALPRPVGAACARNLALAHVRTPYTNWADDDDLFPDDAMAVRLNTLESTRVGWCAGWSEDQHPDGSTTLWRCPTPPGRHEAGDVWTYWKSPADTIPIGPTTILARTDLVRGIYQPLRDHSSDLLTTLACYLDTGRSLEATARELFVHPNTVRYRLKRVSEVIGWDATGPREALILQTALVLGSIGTDATRRRPQNARRSPV